MLLKACLNGARRPAEHPSLPVTPAALAADAARVVAAGTGAVHLHVKNELGADTLDPAALAHTLEVVRRAVGAVPIGVTTGAWTAPHLDDRLAAISSWSSLPDFASVNWHEHGAEQVAEALLFRGVGVEAGLWTADGTKAWLASRHRAHCLRVLVELPDGLDESSTEFEADALLALLRSAGTELPILLHGEGSSAWPALRCAGRWRLHTRIGMEDVLHLPDGSPALDNLALVSAAQSLLAEIAGPGVYGSPA